MKSSADYRTFLVPLRDLHLMSGVFLSCLTVLAAQVILMLLVALYFFKTFASIPILVISLLVLSSLFILIGMLVGYSLHKESYAILGSVLIATVLMFVSDFIVPLDVLPRTLSLVAELNPMVIGGDIVRLALLFTGIGLQATLMDIAMLAGYAVIASVAVVIVYRHSSKSMVRGFVSSMLKGPRKGKKAF